LHYRVTTMEERKRILFAPLDWGLGHATRCIPLIHQELAAGNEVLLAATGRSAKLLEEAFPDLPVLDIPAYAVKYPHRGPFELHFIRQMPRLLFVIAKERQWLKHLLGKHHLDLVISDNRYGLTHPDVRCVMITHQLFPIVSGGLQPFVHRMIHRYLRRFDAIWIPDHAGDDNLSGQLSHGPCELPTEFLGPLSRFQGHASDEPSVPGPDVLVLLSGPEPQRTMLQEMLTSILSDHPREVWMVNGKPGESGRPGPGQVFQFAHLHDEALAGAVRSARVIICRSGYSTLMDLLALGRKGILVPTPGQSEQEYLASRFAMNSGWPVVKQRDLTSVLPGLLADEK